MVTIGDALRPSIRALTWRCDLRSEHGEWHRTLHLPGLAWDDDGHAHTTLPDVPPLDTTTGVPCGCRRPELAEEVYE
ncbi:hypothetical protein [Prauserella sediminis]|nr:hypothetical protein [Prauserella sediminis]